MTRYVQALAVFLLALGAWGDTVTLKPEAVVQGPKVLLGDIADIEGENAETLKAVELTLAPAPGASRQVDAALIDARLRNAGLEGVVMAGATRTKATTLSLEITSDMLAEDLRRFVETAMPWNPGEATIDVEVPAQALVVPDGEVEFKWRPNAQYQYVGPGSFRGEIRVDGALKKTVLCKATVEAYGNVVVATRDIATGKTVSPSDVTIEKRLLSETPDGVVQNPQDVVGSVTRSNIRAGQTIPARNIVARLIIKRGQLVNIEYHSGPLVITGQAKAKADGREGDSISCENPESKELFQGTVRRDGVVVVE